jgi:diaminopimelate decarboxylase
MSRTLELIDWNLEASKKGALIVGGCNAVELAREYGTPLHVVHEARLQSTAEAFMKTTCIGYPGRVSVHFPFKCNSVPGVVQIIRRAGLKAEVMTEFELALAQHLGFDGSEIIVNGPCKTETFLAQCMRTHVRLVVVDSLDELQILNEVADSLGSEVSILLRINPDYIPRGMNEGSATGSRKGCAFGLDFKGGEVSDAFNVLKQTPRVKFEGFHLHIGTGIRTARDYSNALHCLPQLIADANRLGFKIQVLDVGGGFASATTRELTGKEMLIYQGFGKLPEWNVTRQPAVKDFIQVITSEILKNFTSDGLPELIFEPGRCIASPNQLLLLTIHRVKERHGVGKWLIADGGLSTVTLPTYYEYHEIFLCDDVHRPRIEKVNIIGPACFAADVIYRNKWMPETRPGEVIAIMDTGAYFTAMESSFGFPHPAIVAVKDGSGRLIRNRESFDEMIQRDIF